MMMWLSVRALIVTLKEIGVTAEWVDSGQRLWRG